MSTVSSMFCTSLLTNSHLFFHPSIFAQPQPLCNIFPLLSSMVSTWLWCLQFKRPCTCEFVWPGNCLNGVKGLQPSFARYITAPPVRTSWRQIWRKDQHCSKIQISIKLNQMAKAIKAELLLCILNYNPFFIIIQNIWIVFYYLAGQAQTHWSNLTLCCSKLKRSCISFPKLSSFHYKINIHFIMDIHVFVLQLGNWLNIFLFQFGVKSNTKSIYAKTNSYKNILLHFICKYTPMFTIRCNNAVFYKFEILEIGASTKLLRFLFLDCCFLFLCCEVSCKIYFLQG